MLNAIIKNKDQTAVIKLPCKRMHMAEQLVSIGINASANNIKCTDADEEKIKVKIYGTGEFENRLACLASSSDSLGTVNTMCELYQNLPYQNKLNAMQVVFTQEVSSIDDFIRRIANERIQDTTEKYYCPLSAVVYTRNEYGDLDEYSDEYNGRFLAPYEEAIREHLKMEDACDDNNLAEYFKGSNSASVKLKEVHFSTQNVGGILYGCIRAELTEPFTPEEESEFKSWLRGQCSDGYGEGFEQHAIPIEDGEMYVSYRQSSDDYFLRNEDEFDEYLINQNMGGIQ